MQLHFKVRGSHGDVYNVKFEQTGGNLNAYCTCQAGQNGQYCKHRIGLMNGEPDNLIDGNTSDLILLKKFMIGTDLEAAYRRLLAAEERHTEAKNQVALAKKDFTKAMYR